MSRSRDHDHGHGHDHHDHDHDRDHDHDSGHAHSHSHGHHRGHHHGHAETPASSRGRIDTESRKNARRLVLSLSLTLSYMVAEILGGLWTGSLALLADAAHMFSDSGSLALSLFAVWIGQRPANPRQTFGYYRSEILAALVQGALLVVVAIFIWIEAHERFAAPVEVKAPAMLAVSLGGLLVNVLGLWILSGGKAANLNIRGAWLHMLTDMMGSFAVLISAAVIALTGWSRADSVASALVGVLVVYSAWPLLKQALAILMEGAPGHIDVDQVRDAMAAIPGVIEVHDLHVWTITQGLECLAGHVVVAPDRDQQDVLRALRAELQARFGIDHITIQLELAGLHGDKELVCD